MSWGIAQRQYPKYDYGKNEKEDINRDTHKDLQLQVIKANVHIKQRSIFEYFYNTKEETRHTCLCGVQGSLPPHHPLQAHAHFTYYLSHTLFLSVSKWRNRPFNKRLVSLLYPLKSKFGILYHSLHIEYYIFRERVRLVWGLSSSLLTPFLHPSFFFALDLFLCK